MMTNEIAGLPAPQAMAAIMYEFIPQAPKRVQSAFDELLAILHKGRSGGMTPNKRMDVVTDAGMMWMFKQMPSAFIDNTSYASATFKELLVLMYNAKYAGEGGKR